MMENLLHATEHLAGFVIVMLALALLWALTALMGRIFASQRTDSEVTRLEARKPTDPEPEIIPDELVAVYAAAAAMLDEHHRIVSVTARSSYWGTQGRRDIHASHRIR